MATKRLCSLYEVWEIVEMKDDCVYRTRYTGRNVWIPLDVFVLRQVGMELYITPDIPNQAIEYREDWISPQ